MVLASKVHPIPLKFLSKEGQNCRHFELSVTSNCETKTSPRYPTAGLVSQFDVTDKQPACQPANYDSKWRRAVLNFGPLWRGISVGSDALSKLKPRSVAQLSVIFLLAISKNTSFLEWPPSTLWRPSDWTVLWCECDFWNFEPVNVPRCC